MTFFQSYRQALYIEATRFIPTQTKKTPPCYKQFLLFKLSTTRGAYQITSSKLLIS